jgi:hypothetical protein
MRWKVNLKKCIFAYQIPYHLKVHPIRNSNGTLNPAGIIIKPIPDIAGLQSPAPP